MKRFTGEMLRPAALILIVGLLVVGCGQTPDPELRAMLDALRDADRRIQSIELHMTQTIESKRSAAVHSGKEPGNRKEMYLRDDAAEYYEHMDEHGRGMRLSIAGGEANEVNFQDGKPLTPFRGAEAKRLTELHSIPLPTRILFAAGDLQRALVEDEFTRVGEKTEIDGISVDVVEGKWRIGETPGTYRLYLDPELGHLPRRCENLDPDGIVVLRKDFGDYREAADGIWIAHTVVTTSINSLTQEPSQVNTFTIHEVTVNKPIDAARFVTPFIPNPAND